MKRTINNYHKLLDESNSKMITVNYRDTVEFVYGNETIGYDVSHDHLSCCNRSNEKIFQLLNIPTSTADDLYGYPSNQGFRPEYHRDDFNAASRLIKHLFNLIKESDKNREKIRSYKLFIKEIY